MRFKCLFSAKLTLILSLVLFCQDIYTQTGIPKFKVIAFYIMMHVPEKYRVLKGRYKSDITGNNGAFEISRGRTAFWILASDGAVSDGEPRWEHVSVHCINDGTDRTPTWAEMCYIKSIFWDEEDCVVQYHPAKSEYVNMHRFTLHLWRPKDQLIPVASKIMVGC